MCRPLDGMPVAVVGAGVAGLCAAAALVAQGAHVDVYERAARIGAGNCSWQAGGMLAPQCEGEGGDRLITERGQRALSWWPAHTQSFRQLGTLVLAASRDAGELMHFSAMTQGHGWLNRDEITRIEPALEGRFSRGLFFAQEGHLEPRKALPELAEQLRGAGVNFRFGVDLAPEMLVDQTVVDARGLQAASQLHSLRGVRGEAVLIRSHDIKLSRPVRLLHPRMPIYIVPRDDGMFLVGATAVESDSTQGMSVRSALQLLNAAYTVHPAFAEAEIVELGVGVRPALPSNLPQVSMQGRNISINGLYRHGYLLSPWYAEDLAQQLVNQVGARA